MALPNEDREYTVRGRVNNRQTGDFLEGVSVRLAGEEVKTDNQGRFSITVKLPTDPEDDTVSGPRFITYTKSRFTPNTQNIITGGNKVKTTLDNTALDDIETAIEREINKQKRRAEEVIDQVKNALPKDAVRAIMAFVTRALQRLASSLVPLLIRLLINFGISSFDQRQDRVCPNRDGLMNTVRRKNKITRELNNIFARITAISALAAIFLSLRGALTAARISIFNIPLPTTLGIPPGPAGGVIFSQPIGATMTLDDTVDKIKENESKFGSINTALLSAVLMLTIVIARIVRMNQEMDELIAECGEELGEEFTSEVLAQELIDLANEEVTEQGQPATPIVNGFNLSVQVDDMAVGSLKRRFAVARDSNGVIVLRGEKSLSATDQILIDELSYYIQSNDLKA